jgi:predicted transcriptional regulator
MVMHDVEQLPVVRDGEFIGFVTRNTILRTLREGVTRTNREEESDS